MDTFVTCTYHSSAEQDALYAQGRTKPGAKLTNDKGGQSRHNDTYHGEPGSTAFDIVPLDAAGKAIRDVRHPHWNTAGQIGQGLGLDWVGAWRSFKDYPHFELKK